MATRTKADAGMGSFLKGDFVHIDGSDLVFEVLGYSGPKAAWVHLGKPLESGRGWRSVDVHKSSVHLIRRAGEAV